MLVHGAKKIGLRIYVIRYMGDCGIAQNMNEHGDGGVKQRACATTGTSFPSRLDILRLDILTTFITNVRILT